jgi:hypothetical protein
MKGIPAVGVRPPPAEPLPPGWVDNNGPPGSIRVYDPRTPPFMPVFVPWPLAIEDTPIPRQWTNSDILAVLHLNRDSGAESVLDSLFSQTSSVMPLRASYIKELFGHINMAVEVQRGFADELRLRVGPFIDNVRVADDTAREVFLGAWRLIRHVSETPRLTHN